jgi:hypothetical protein
MKKQLQYHRLAEAFPMLPEEEIETLAKDIKDHGLHEPIILHEGKILDGRNRYKACLRAGVEPSTKTWKNLPESAHTTPRNWVISKNLHRRHLTVAQRAVIAAALATLKQGERKTGNPEPMTQPEAAKLMQVSPASLKRAATVIKRGWPELIEAVKCGETTLGRAMKQIVKGRRGGSLKEKDFYQPFADWLKQRKECTKAVVLGGNPLQDKWATPDVIGTSEARLNDMVRSRIEIVAAEIKVEILGLLPAFGQACAYRLFAHKSYLVIPANALKHEIDRVHALCRLFGIGLVLFDNKNKQKPHFKIRVRSQKHEPNKFYQNKFITRIRDKLFS